MLPLRAGMKVPVQRDWPELATADPRTIWEWFGFGGLYVGNNLGVATGSASNLWVLDVDLGHGEEAGRSIGALIAQHGADLTRTRMVVTPSGGRHYWFSWPAVVPDEHGERPTWRNINATAATALGAGIDVRAEGGQVAVWPSILADGSEYQQGEGDLFPVPVWLAERTQYVEKAARGEAVSKVDLDAATQDRAGRYALQALNGVVAELRELTASATSDGQGYQGAPWNATSFAKACRILELANADWSGFTVAEGFDLFFTEAPRDAGFTDDTVATVWKSAERTVGDKPATLPASTLDLNPDGTMFGTRTVVMDRGTGSPASVTVNDHDGLPLFTDRGVLLPTNVAQRLDQDDLAIGVDEVTWIYESGVWRRSPDAIVQRAARLLGNTWKHQYLATITDSVFHVLGLPRLGDLSRFDLINTRSGMIDWTATPPRLLPHEKGLRSTIQLPVEWDPAATCPVFDRWVDQVVPGGADRLWEVIGYMVAPGNSLQRAILLLGSGNNGKGTLIRMLQSLIGKHNTSAVTLQSMSDKSYSVADLYGKQANLAGDLDAKYLRDTGMFKMLTGGDVVEARRIYRDPFEFTCHATPLFSANEVWRSGDNTKGYRRRWVIVPMTQDVSRFPALNEADLVAELPGILVKAVTALQRLMVTREFTETAETEAVREEFDTASDVTRTWLAEDDAITVNSPGSEDRANWTYRSHLYARFSRWAQANGHAAPPASGKFYRHLIGLGYLPLMRNAPAAQGGGRGFLGLVVNATADGFERNTFTG